jgi:two-component system cell cycle response regulator DivK
MTAVRKTAKSAPPPKAKSPLVLVVDDFPDNRDMYMQYLEFSGLRVAEAQNGHEALQQAFSLLPDLIVMDLSLPGLDGWEATRRLKAEAATKAVPVIALTAHAMAGDREKALEAGCDDYDTKPIELPRLLGKIETLLQKRATP